MVEVKPLTEYKTYNKTALFLAGGISGCSDWQKEMIELLSEKQVIIFNPRREEFDLTKEEESKKQIVWEACSLTKATCISFWFAEETLNPITLFELGRWAGRKKLFVGVHPNYARKFDVVMQLSLIDSEIEVVYSIEELATQIKEYLK